MTDTQVTPRSYTNDPASLLASRDGAGDPGPYATALDGLGPSCTEDRVHLAGLADAGKLDLDKHGIHETRLSVLSGLQSSIQGALSFKTNCGQILAAYLLLREG